MIFYFLPYGTSTSFYMKASNQVFNTLSTCIISSVCLYQVGLNSLYNHIAPNNSTTTDAANGGLCNDNELNLLSNNMSENCNGGNTNVMPTNSVTNLNSDNKRENNNDNN